VSWYRSVRRLIEVSYSWLIISPVVGVLKPPNY